MKNRSPSRSGSTRAASSGSTGKAPQTLYKADNGWPEQVSRTRQRLIGVCGQCMNRKVRIETIDGHVYEGIVVGSDSTYLHLMSGDSRFFGPYASSAILTLVLYELLVITLLI
ncbi:hypothetical protein ACF3MZ_21945 [Paenibacillaceae bacterium WGS1546]|uniref:hypothetical protein n=1 Tax=Cohnella sp. WGS1546 TaxID=3366810 RepID=UPI00372D2062